MLKRVYKLSKTFDEQFRIQYHYFILEDTEFGKKTFNLVDTDCALARIVIAEYSERHMNVTYNLKLLFSHLTQGQSLEDAERILYKNRWTCNAHNLNFDQYYPCLQRHLKRLQFVGRLK